MTGLDSSLSALQIAKIEIVGNEWQELGIHPPEVYREHKAIITPNKDFQIRDPDIIEESNEDIESFQIAVVNTEDNADYTPPKGVKGEYDRLNQIRAKEQSLVLQFNNLPAGYSGAAQKTLYTLNDNQKRSFMTYDYMKMYVYGDSPWITSLDSDVEIFLRFGMGEDFYEITQPVYTGWDEDENRNSFTIPLDWLAALKLQDSTNIKRLKTSDIFICLLYTSPSPRDGLLSRMPSSA